MQTPILERYQRYKLPIEFLSPYSLEECVVRLEAKRGNYLGTEILLGLAEADEYRVEFHIKVRNVRGPSNNFIDMDAVGYLEAYDDSETKVVIQSAWLGMWTHIYAVLLFVIASLLTVAVLVQSLPSLFFQPIGLVVTLAVGVITAAIWWIMKRSSSMEKLMDIIEDTLVYARNGKEKLKFKRA